MKVDLRDSLRPVDPTWLMSEECHAALFGSSAENDFQPLTWYDRITTKETDIEP
jgi:hypothetical protein